MLRLSSIIKKFTYAWKNNGSAFSVGIFGTHLNEKALLQYFPFTSISDYHLDDKSLSLKYTDLGTRTQISMLKLKSLKINNTLAPFLCVIYFLFLRLSSLLHNSYRFALHFISLVFIIQTHALDVYATNAVNSEILAIW